MPVLEPQHRAHRAGQVDRGIGRGVHVVGVVAGGGVGQDVFIGVDAPGAGGVPLAGVGEAVRERQDHRHGGGGGIVGRDRPDVVGVADIGPVVVGRADGQPRVGEGSRRGVGDRADEGVVAVLGVGVGRAQDAVGAEGRPDAAGRPVDLRGLEAGHGREHADGRRGVGDGELVEEDVGVGQGAVIGVHEPAHAGVAGLVGDQRDLDALPLVAEVAGLGAAAPGGAPVDAAVGGDLQVEGGVVAEAALDPGGELRIGHGGQVEVAGEAEVGARLRGDAVEVVARGGGALEAAGGGLPAGGFDPVPEAAFEVLDERHGQKRGAFVGHLHVVELPALVGAAAVGGQAEEDLHVGVALVVGEVHDLLLPVGARPVHAVQPEARTARRGHLEIAEVVHRQPVPVLEPQHRAHRAGQVDGRIGGAVQVVGIVSGAVFQEGVAAGCGSRGNHPARLQGPQGRAGFKAVAEGQERINGLGHGSGRAVGGVAAPGIHGVDPVVIGGRHEQTRVGPGVARDGERRHGVDGRIVRERTRDHVVRERRGAAGGPVQAQGRGLDLRDRGRRHHGGRIAQGYLVQAPAVGGAGGIAGDAEAQQQGRSAGKSGQLIPGAGPVGGCRREGGQGGPGTAGIGRDFHVTVVAGKERMAVHEHQSGPAPAGEAARRGQGQRGIEAIRVVRAGGILPAPGARPGRVG